MRLAEEDGARRSAVLAPTITRHDARSSRTVGAPPNGGHDRPLIWSPDDVAIAVEAVDGDTVLITVAIPIGVIRVHRDG
ncbi:hypothetical protein [Methylobacterium sp. JK268]